MACGILVPRPGKSPQYIFEFCGNKVPIQVEDRMMTLTLSTSVS